MLDSRVGLRLSSSLLCLTVGKLKCHQIELSIETGEVLYEWSSLDHVDPSGMLLRYSLLRHQADMFCQRVIYP